MDTMKFSILARIHNALPTCPVTKTQLLTRKRGILKANRALNELEQSGYIFRRTGTDSYQITLLGVSALEEERNARRASGRFWISTAIAVAALLVSILALLR